MLNFQTSNSLSPLARNQTLAVKILPLYAAILAIIFAFLSAKIIQLRTKLGIGLGHADNPAMLRAMRVHANFAEYVPFTLLLIYFVELSNSSNLLIHILGGSLLAGRLCHACGVSREPENKLFRVIGMVITITVMVTCAVYLLRANLPFG